MFFSIIIPVYNVEKYLSECVDSILNQTFDSFELILVDDGSTDKSPAICDQYAANDKRVKVIHKENGGQSSARNAGTGIASAEYIIYIDSDDFIMDSDCLKKIYNAAKGKDLIFFKHKKLDDETKQFSNCTYGFSAIADGTEYLDALEAMIKTDSFFGMPWNKCIKREIIEKNGIRFQEGLTGEDMDWIYYVISGAKSLAAIDEPFIAYRQRKNSVTSSVKIKNLSDYVYILEKWADAAENGDYTEKEKRIILSSLAKYYSNLLIMYTRVKDSAKHEYDKRIKKLSALLNYGQSKRPQLVNKIYKLLGFSLTVKALSVLDRIK